MSATVYKFIVQRGQCHTLPVDEEGVAFMARVSGKLWILKPETLNPSKGLASPPQLNTLRLGVETTPNH